MTEKMLSHKNQICCYLLK